MAIIGEGISHRGLVHEDFNIPFNVAATMTQADVGKPVTLDDSADRAVKLAGDGDPIIGILMSFEDRSVEGVKVGTVAMKGGFRVTGTAAVGDTVVGAATAGEVKAAVAADYSANIVTFVDGDAIEILIS